MIHENLIKPVTLFSNFMNRHKNNTWLCRENYNKALILEQFRKLLDIYEIPKQCNGMVDISIQHLIFPVTCAERK